MNAERMDLLSFRGVIRDGAGLFAQEIEIPGAEELSIPIRDWPDAVEPGTLNVRILEYPDSFEERFGAEDIRRLDTRRFMPEAEIPQHEIGNNTLTPSSGDPDIGNAQVWRATLRSERSGEERLCWVVRRIGSGMVRVLECVASEHLRTSMKLRNEDEVTLVLEGTWQ